MRELQPYIVSLYKNEFELLCEQGGIIKVGYEGAYNLISDKEKFYHDKTGILIDKEDEDKKIFIL